MEIANNSCSQRVKQFVKNHPEGVRNTLVTAIALSVIGIVVGFTLVLLAGLGHLPMSGIGQAILFPSATVFALSLVFYVTRSSSSSQNLHFSSSQPETAPGQPTHQSGFPSPIPPHVYGPLGPPQSPRPFERKLSPLVPQAAARDPHTPLHRIGVHRTTHPATSPRLTSGRPVPSPDLSPVAPRQLFAPEISPEPSDASSANNLSIDFSGELSPGQDPDVTMVSNGTADYVEKLAACLAPGEHCIPIVGYRPPETEKAKKCFCLLSKDANSAVTPTYTTHLPNPPERSTDVTARVEMFHRCAEELGIDVDYIGTEYLKNRELARECDFILLKFHHLGKALVIENKDGQIEGAHVRELATSDFVGVSFEKNSPRPQHYIIHCGTPAL